MGLLFIFCGASGATVDTNWTGLIPYFTTNAVTATNKPPGTNLPAGSRWMALTNNLNLRVGVGETIWFAFLNNEDTNNTKSFHLEIDVLGHDNIYSFYPDDADGFDAEGNRKTAFWPPDTKASDWIHFPTNHTNRVCFDYQFKPQPAWERISYYTARSTATITNVQAWSVCSRATNATDGIKVENIKFGAAGTAVMRVQQIVREIRIFLKRVLGKINAINFSAPAGTGNWTPRVEILDPDGNPRGIGVSWVTDGHGLAAGQPFSFSFALEGPQVDWLYSLYAFDATSGKYQEYTLDLRDAFAPNLSPGLELPGAGFQFDAWPGFNYVVESSADLLNWQMFQQFVGAGQRASIPFDGLQPMRFFRTKVDVALAAPTLVSAASSSAGDRLIVTFGAPVDELSAADPANYVVQNRGPMPAVSSAFLRGPETVELLLDPPLSSVAGPLLWAQGVSDTAGNLLAPAAVAITASSPETPCENGEWIESTVVERLCYPDGFWHLLQDSLYKCPDGKWRFYQVRNDTTADPCP